MTRSLLHLSDPTSGPLILHTLPPPPPSTSTEVAAAEGGPRLVKAAKYTSTNAGLCKLVSIAEVLKREFAEFQRGWRAEQYREQEASKSKKGKEVDAAELQLRDATMDSARTGDAQEAQAAAPPSTDHLGKDATASASAAGQSAQTAQQGKRQGKGAVPPSSTSQAMDDAMQAQTSATGKRKRAPPLLHLYQYNELNCFERLPGYDKLLLSESGQQEEQQDTEPETEAETETNSVLVPPSVPSDATATPAADPVDAEARAKLDAAILEQVVRGKRRPRKKHTPYMRVTLFSSRLPSLERDLKARGQDYTIQFPERPKRVRRRKGKRNGDMDAAVEVRPEGEEVVHDDGTAPEANKPPPALGSSACDLPEAADQSMDVVLEVSTE